MDKLRKSTSSDMARLEAAMRKADLQVVSLQNSLEQKVCHKFYKCSKLKKPRLSRMINSSYCSGYACHFTHDLT